MCAGSPSTSRPRGAPIVAPLFIVIAWVFVAVSLSPGGDLCRRPLLQLSGSAPVRTFARPVNSYGPVRDKLRSHA